MRHYKPIAVVLAAGQSVAGQGQEPVGGNARLEADIAALEGHSWTAQPTRGRPVAIRFNPRSTEAVLEPSWHPALRAAA